VVRASIVRACCGLLVILLVAGGASGQDPGDPLLEAERERLEQDGMDLVRVTVTNTVALREGERVDLEFPATHPPQGRTVLEGLEVIHIEPERSSEGLGVFVAVPIEVSRMIREAEEEGVGFVLYPRLDIEDLEKDADPNGPNDRLILPDHCGQMRCARRATVTVRPQAPVATVRIAFASASGTSS